MYELTLSDILRIEDLEGVTGICCADTGIPIWTTIRSPFLRLIQRDMLYGIPLVSEGVIRPGMRWRAMQIIARSFAYNAWKLKSLQPVYPVMLMATGARLIKHEGKYFNALSDYFVAAMPGATYATEDIFDWKWPFPRHHGNTLLQSPMRVQGVLWGQLRTRQYWEQARVLVDLIGQSAKAILGWELTSERRRWLEQLCVLGAASLLPRYRTYQALFKKLGNKLLIKEEGCYGGADNASAMLAARHMGIVTAEYQHGMISAGHDAYNFSSAIINSQIYRQILPDYFLTYGSWWGEQINAPVTKIPIGNPHRTSVLENSLEGEAMHGKRILVLGEGVESRAYLEFCDQIAAGLGDACQVVFRPHPLERASVFKQYPNGFYGRILIDNNQDIYRTFREVGAVLAEASTGLFEAIGLVPKIFLWNTPKARFSYPSHPFQCFSDANELVQLLADESAGQVSSQQLESVWAPGWKRNYLDFVDKVLH